MLKFNKGLCYDYFAMGNDFVYVEVITLTRKGSVRVDVDICFIGKGRIGCRRFS